MLSLQQTAAGIQPGTAHGSAAAQNMAGGSGGGTADRGLLCYPKGILLLREAMAMKIVVVDRPKFWGFFLRRMFHI